MAKQNPFIICLRGFVGRDESLHEFEHAFADMLDPQKILSLLRERKIKRVILGGGVSRPGPMALLSIYSFFRNREELRKIVSGGDDRILRGVIRLIEDNGFSVIGIDEAAPQLLAPEGLIGSVAETKTAASDIVTALEFLRKISPYDVGQGVVIAEGRVLAIEGPEGTDAMLERVRLMQKNRRVILENKSAILVKAPKQGQDHRVDLPAIGPRTIKVANEAGLGGIAIAANEVIILLRSQTVQAADRAGLFLKGVPRL
ncbi:MAG: LpxI family protein [Alphaproteobacteria bacterium]|nr:LpxI family protein [Alphaproteobacteria bacterium]